MAGGEDWKFNDKAQRGQAATKNDSIRKPRNHEIISMILGFLVSL